MNNAILKRLQDCEFSILCMIDEFCKSNHIQYSLYAGTALGAVRHSTFIPWDDDIDIAMTRTEYDKFCKMWINKPVPGYYLESILTDEDCGLCHAKIRKEGTILLSRSEYEDVGHHGIWVDIFPLDMIPKDKKVNKKKKRIGREMIFLSRANVDLTTDNKMKKIKRAALRIIPRKKRIKKLNTLHTWLVEHMEDGIKEGYEWRNMATLDLLNKHSFISDPEMKYTNIMFNGKFFPIFECYDNMLKDAFGDYMVLPPEEDRICKRNPVKIQFE